MIFNTASQEDLNKILTLLTSLLGNGETFQYGGCVTEAEYNALDPEVQALGIFLIVEDV